MAPVASVVMINGNVHTLDGRTRRASALALAEGRIIAVGDDDAVQAVSGVGTTVIDLGGRTVTPGLIDAHLHPVLGATKAIGIDLTGVRDPARALALLREEADRRIATGSGWVRAHSLDYRLFDRMPMTAEAIEGAVRGLPAFLFLFDGHTALASAAALRASGVSSARTYPDASRIVVDDEGTPTGRLEGESAIDDVLAHAPTLSPEAAAAEVRTVLAGLGGSGITGACIMDGTIETLELLSRIDEVGDGLPVRLVTAFDHTPNDGIEGLPQRLALREARGRRWRGGLVKLYADSVIDTGTGWLYEPDTDGDGLRPFWADQRAFAEVVTAYASAGFQIATHAIGDRAIGSTIDAYIAAGERATPAVPHRIEHLECMADRDLPRMSAAGITASVQPLHMQWIEPDGSDAWSRRLGPERAARGWRTRDMLDAGLRVALGSDWPVAQVDARVGLAWARLRRAPGADPDTAIQPGQALTPLEALQGYTVAAAAAQGDRDLGRLRPGFRADLVVWEDDPLRVAADDLPDL
ncbi:amidohydrolase, partial [Microbacterium sp. CCH5-D1]|uniref:amidohydrolase n=1 Tax=Microbacterium sp. CCH5-D1 TaxID=1768780 RepID=UPI00076A07C3